MFEIIGQIYTVVFLILGTKKLIELVTRQRCNSLDGTTHCRRKKGHSGPHEGQDWAGTRVRSGCSYSWKNQS
jgi:hypothetical protein